MLKDPCTLEELDILILTHNELQKKTKNPHFKKESQVTIDALLEIRFEMTSRTNCNYASIIPHLYPKT